MADRGDVEESPAAREHRIRVEISVLALLVLGCSGIYGFPQLASGFQGLFPVSVSCSELVGRRVHPEGEGRYVVMHGCSPSYDAMSGSVHLNQAVSELQLPLLAVRRGSDPEDAAVAIITRHDLVRPFSEMNASQTHALRRGTLPELDPAQVDAVVAAKTTIGEELDRGMGGVLRGRTLIHGDPPGFGLGYLVMVAGSAVLAGLAIFAPRERIGGLLALFGRSSGNDR